MDLPVPDIVRDMDSSVRWAALLLTVSLLFSAVILRAVAGSGRASATLNKPVSASGGRRARGNPTVLLVGPMAGGKTSFFSRLVYGTAPPTHTSMTPSSASIPEKNVQLVDLPGHPRLRSHLLAQHLPTASGIVFFIDPTVNAAASGIQATAEHLHILLALLRHLRKSRPTAQLPPVLILLSKSDSWSAAQRARAQDRVRSALERELDKRRKAAAASGTSGEARLQSLDELPTGPTELGPFAKLLARFTGRKEGSGAAGADATASKLAAAGPASKLPEDEQEILQSDVLSFEGPFSWEEQRIGVSITWAVGSAKVTEASGVVDKPKVDPSLMLEKPQTDQDEGVSGFWAWLRERV